MTRLLSLASASAAATLLAVAWAPPTAIAVTRTAAVYYVGDTGVRAALYREFRQVPVVGGPIRTAVNAMLHVPPRDPDYASLWPRATRIRGVSQSGNLATINLSREALTPRPGSGFACASLQQLVHTVTAANPRVTRVRLLVEGRSRGVVSTFWGAGCGPDAPMSRLLPSYRILSPVQISNLLHAQFVPRTFPVTGEANVFEATVHWTVTDQATRRVLRQGFTTATDTGLRFGTFRFVVSLPPTSIGRAVVVSLLNSFGEGAGLQVTNGDTKAVRVR
jgi:hypothetical protein